MEREKSQGLDPLKSVSSLKTAEDVKAHLENQLRQARLAAQQVVILALILKWGFTWPASYREVNQLRSFIEYSYFRNGWNNTDQVELLPLPQQQ